jgi:hypothetical protein
MKSGQIFLNNLKKFLDINKKRPSYSNNKDLNNWLRTQINNSRKRTQIMKNDNIYNQWITFITDIKYSKYFN